MAKSSRKDTDRTHVDPEPVEATDEGGKEDSGLGKIGSGRRKPKPKVGEKVAPLSRQRFLEKSEFLQVAVAGKTFMAEPRKFSTGSYGYFAVEKVPIVIDGVVVRLQVNFMATVIGSKNPDPPERIGGAKDVMPSERVKANYLPEGTELEEREDGEMGEVGEEEERIEKVVQEGDDDDEQEDDD